MEEKTFETQETIHKNRLLYDTTVLERCADTYGPTTEIKLHVHTGATIYEIRTALRFWFGGDNDHRCSQQVWNNCQSFKDGQWTLNDDDEIIYADQ